MGSTFPSASLAKKMSVGATILLQEQCLPKHDADNLIKEYVSFLLDRFINLMQKKHADHENIDALKKTEILARYIQLNFIRALRLDPANTGSSIANLEIINSHEKAIQHGSFYPKDWRFHLAVFLRQAKKHYGDTFNFAQPNCTVWDLSLARLWFANNQPIDNETTWELYKRFDPDGSRAMHQASFYSLLPQSYRKLEHYTCINATYENCLHAEKWFANNQPIDIETTWELYKRFDPDGSRAMHQGQFYSLLPQSYRKLVQYTKIDATYEDCINAEKWFANNQPIENENTWELNKRFDPNGSRAMHQRQFYSLLPKSYRKLEQYTCIHATYEDCLHAEKWFANNQPVDNETTWELYKRFDPDGSRAMHQGSFYSLLPMSYRKLEQYTCIHATYEDCLHAEKWFANNQPIDNETTWELYKRFDPDGSRAMHQGSFYSLLPKSYRQLKHYIKSDLSYQDYLTSIAK